MVADAGGRRHEPARRSPDSQHTSGDDGRRAPGDADPRSHDGDRRARAPASAAAPDTVPADPFAFVERRGGTPYRFCDSGKAALQQVLVGAAGPPGGEVLFPAAIPAGVPRAVRAAGFEPRYYPVTRRLRADVAGVASRVCDATTAVLAVDYFGFPQPAFDALAEQAARHDALLIEDNAHGALSAVDGRLLGTRADAGFTSLHKTFPVRRGAPLFGESRDAGSPLPPQDPVSGVVSSAGDAVADCCHSLGERLRTVHPRHAALRQLASSVGKLLTADGAPHPGAVPAAGSGRAPSGPAGTAAAPVPVSLLRRTDAETVVARRRAAYRRWVDALAGAPGVEVIFPRLPAGVCPWRCPVVVDDPAAVRSLLSGVVGGAFTWPPLPPAVEQQFPGTASLASRLVALPVCRELRPGAVDRAVRLFDG